MEIVAAVAGACLAWYPEAAVAAFDREASLGERIVAGTVFAVGTANLLAIIGALSYLIFHGV